MIRTNRVYDLTLTDNDYTILVDRLWPRGVKKGKLRLDLWMKEIAPSDRLRKWFAHDPSKWQDFKRRYKEEILNDKYKMQLLEQIKQIEKENGTVLLVYSASNKENNNAVALTEIIAGIS